MLACSASAQMAGTQAPDGLVAGLAEYVATDPACNIEGLGFHSLRSDKLVAVHAIRLQFGVMGVFGDSGVVCPRDARDFFAVVRLDPVLLPFHAQQVCTTTVLAVSNRRPLGHALSMLASSS